MSWRRNLAGNLLVIIILEVLKIHYSIQTFKKFKTRTVNGTFIRKKK